MAVGLLVGVAVGSGVDVGGGVAVGHGVAVGRGVMVGSDVAVGKGMAVTVKVAEMSATVAAITGVEDERTGDTSAAEVRGTVVSAVACALPS